MREDEQSDSETRHCNNVTPLRKRISTKGNEEVKPFMKAAVGKTLRATLSYLQSEIQTQVGTRGTKSNAENQSLQSRAITPTVVVVSGGRRQSITSRSVT